MALQFSVNNGISGTMELLLASGLGMLTHQCLFIRGEWHMQAPHLLRLYAALGLVLFGFEIVLIKRSAIQSLLQTALSAIVYAGGVFASVVVYRAFFHRLRSFPGPWGAGISKFWHVVQCLRTNSQNHLILQRLHEEYGDFVRTGPTEITVFHPDVFAATDGPKNVCTKAVWYDFLLPEVAVNTTRDKPAHDKRRRIWDQGFTVKALALYHDQIADYANRLEVQIAEMVECGQSVNAMEKFYWFSFDVMGEFAFARSFDMLRDKRWHHAVLMLRRAMSLLGPLSPVPWLAQIGFYLIPDRWIVKDWYSMMNWCKERMNERIEMTPERVDVSTYLIDAARRTGSVEQDRNWLNGDSIAIIIAGSDTVAPTLVFLFYELALHSEHADKLHKELQGVDISDQRQLQSLPHLNGLINETLRVHPPVPTGGYRETPPEGLTIAGTYIPGGTTIVAPRYVIGRREDCFVRGAEFIPERWYSRPEMVLDRRAFVPFSQGRYSCVGKNLALAELRYLTSLLVKKYHVEFALGEDGRDVEGLMKDQFTAAPGGLQLKFSRR